MLSHDVRRVAGAALPLYVSMVAVSVSALVTTAALGRSGTVELAAFSVTGAVYFPALAAVTGAVRGVLPFVRPGDVEQVVRDGAWLAVFAGLLGAVAVACVPLVARGSGVEPEVVAALGAFPAFMAAGVVITGFGAMGTSVLVGLGRGKAVLRACLLVAACTAVLSPLLVGFFGLNGAGVAYCAAQSVGCAVTMSLLRGELRHGPGWKVHLGHVVELARVGLPLAGTALVKFAVLGVLAIAAARISATAAAAHNIATSLVGLAFTAAIAIGQAVVPVVSARAGGDGVRRAVAAGLVVALVALPVGCGIVVLGDVVPLFSTDPAVVAVVRGLLPLVVLVVFADGVQAVLGFGLVGLKRTTPSLVVFAVCFGVLAAVALGTRDLTGLWVALVVADVAIGVGQGTAFLLAVRLRRTAR
ncbi:multidrug resistance protein, MATE family [Lentzea fradiae]|uniref:Probable multidrug resistance protein NorM n=1 Tax=Lentzea fradiae TaxID=200378 RepID=A0A1G7VCQ1_9PSEU|nr:multidrug resistance protein, MATE family [Lentzea fradiae]